MDYWPWQVFKFVHHGPMSPGVLGGLTGATKGSERETSLSHAHQKMVVVHPKLEFSVGVCFGVKNEGSTPRRESETH